MQVCNCGKKVSVITVVSFVLSCFLFAADMEMPVMPSMPEMPYISLDGTFYTPSMPNSMMGNNNENEKEETENKTIITSGDTADELLMSLGQNDSTLTASDISTLHDSGLFTDLSSLASGILGGSVGTGNINQYQTDNATNVLLQEILNQLNELKEEQKKAAPEEQEQLSQNKKDSANFKQRNPSVLRFKINDYNMKDSLEEVFLSDTEDDGSFLLTADRKYVANNKTRTETFYLLFKAKKDKGAAVSYDVMASIVQDYENKNSFIYKMTQIKNLIAQKTGNLVVLRYDGGGLKIDLLLDIDKR